MTSSLHEHLTSDAGSMSKMVWTSLTCWHQMQNSTAEQFIAHSSAMAFKVVVIVSCFHIYVSISLDFLDLPIVRTAYES